jgi:hypothetical protein
LIFLCLREGLNEGRFERDNLALLTFVVPRSEDAIPKGCLDYFEGDLMMALALRGARRMPNFVEAPGVLKTRFV